MLCGGKHGLSPWDMHDTFASLRILERCDVKVRRQKHLKVHAKLLLADGKSALLGSMNLDRSAFDLRRELGVVVDVPPIVERLGELFDHDWHKGEHWKPPTRSPPTRTTSASSRTTPTSSMTEPAPRPTPGRARARLPRPSRSPASGAGSRPGRSASWSIGGAGSTRTSS